MARDGRNPKSSFFHAARAAGVFGFVFVSGERSLNVS